MSRVDSFPCWCGLCFDAPSSRANVFGLHIDFTKQGDASYSLVNILSRYRAQGRRRFRLYPTPGRHQTADEVIMRLRHIEAFHAVMQAGTISGAAQLLFVTQPAVTKVLQHCERQLGVSLFVRTKGRLYPTPEARRLFCEVDRLHRDLQAVRRLAAGMREKSAETVRLLSTPALAVSVVPEALKLWRRKFPSVRCTIATQHTREIVNGLLLGECEMALSLQDPLHPMIAATRLAEGQMEVIAPLGTWTTDQASRDCEVEDLPHQLIGLPDDDPLGNRVLDACAALDREIAIDTVVQTYQLARTLVESGAGAAVVDPFTASGLDLQKAQRRALSPQFPVQMLLLQNSSAPLSISAIHLVECLTNAAAACLAPAAAWTVRDRAVQQNLDVVLRAAGKSLVAA